VQVVEAASGEGFEGEFHPDARTQEYLQGRSPDQIIAKLGIDKVGIRGGSVKAGTARVSWQALRCRFGFVFTGDD